MIETFLTLSPQSRTDQAQRPYGTDVLTIKVYRDEPGTVLLGGAKFPVALLPSKFPVRVTLGLQNAVQSSSWIDATSRNPQDVWIYGTICRPNSDTDNEGIGTPKTIATTTTRTTSDSSSACPMNYKPLLEAKGISKWIMLPSTSSSSSDRQHNDGVDADTTTTATGGGIRAPATLPFRTISRPFQG
jgi:hypothetical protein